MNSQHLSDEALAAFADGVLGGHARDRATRHTAGCPECAHAVAVQREAIWALRAAPAPALPVSLVDRLRAVPITTPMRLPTTVMAADGSAMFPTFGSAALVPTQAPSRTNRHFAPLVATAAAVAIAGVVAVGSAAGGGASVHPNPGNAHTVRFQPQVNAPAPALQVVQSRMFGR